MNKEQKPDETKVVEKPVIVQLDEIIEKIKNNTPKEEGIKRDCLLSAIAHIMAAITKINKAKE